MSNQFDVVVIGAGPAGYVAAIRCAQLGLSTACIDNRVNDQGKSVLGGTCLNIGCIPSKALLESSSLYDQALHKMGQHGIKTREVTLDLLQMLARKNQIVAELTHGIEGLFRANKVKSFLGSGRLHSPGQVAVQQGTSNEVTLLTSKVVILATGSRPVEISSAPLTKNHIVDSTGALEFNEVPATLGIVGAGIIGLELGSVWQRLGSRVMLFEALPEFLPAADEQIAREALKNYQQQGLEFHFNTRVTQCETKGKHVQVHTTAQGKTRTHQVDRLIVAVGRRPNSEHLASEQIKLQLDARGFVQVDDLCRTNIPNVYAIGDLVRGPMLAHKGSEEGMMVAELIAGHAASVNYDNIPSVIYTHPEIAWTGATEQNLREQGVAYNTGVFPFNASGRARAAGDVIGMVKVIADAKTDRVLGVHMMGAHCSELIMQAVIAREFSAASEDLALTMFAHPTLSEAFHEAALAVDNRAIHIAGKRGK